MGGINAKTAHSQIFPQYQDLHVLKKTKKQQQKKTKQKNPTTTKKPTIF